MDEPRAARYSDLFAARRDHGPDCAYWPVCATVSVVRKTIPEVLDHLAGAARELLGAAAKLLEEAERVVAAASESSRPKGTPEADNVRHIDAV